MNPEVRNKHRRAQGHAFFVQKKFKLKKNQSSCTNCKSNQPVHCLKTTCTQRLSHSMQSPSQFKTAAYQVRIWGSAKIFPHEALKVMESQDQRLHGVHQNHWQEYQALHRLAQRGNASTLTCQGKSQKKAYECSKTESQREKGLSTHCRNNETSFNTHRAWGIHSGRRRSMEKRALYLKHKKNTEKHTGQ